MTEAYTQSHALNDVAKSLSNCELALQMYIEYHEQFKQTWDETETNASLKIIGSISLLSEELVKMLGYCEPNHQCEEETLKYIKSYVDYTNSFSGSIITQMKKLIVE